MSVSDFENLNSRYNKEDLYGYNDRKTPSKITFNKASVDEGKVSFDAIIEYNNETISLNGNSELFHSYKYDNYDANSFVADIEDENENFKVLLFEIYNEDNKKDVTFTSVAISNKPHLKLYLTDHEDNIIIFETSIPKEFQKIDDSDIHTDEKEINDLFWFRDIIEPQVIKEMPVDKELLEIVEKSIEKENSLTASGKTQTWTHTTNYYSESYFGGRLYQSYSLPYGNYKYLNVAGDTTWTNEFRIAEHTKVDGQTLVNQENEFKYSNVKLDLGVGACTVFLRTYLQGKANRSDNKLSILVGDKVWSTALPKAPSLATVRSWINAITGGQSKTVNLSGAKVNISRNAGKKVAQSTKSGGGTNNYFIKSSEKSGGHYLELQAVAQYEGTTNYTNANGAMKVSWTVHSGTTTYTNGTKNISFKYNSTNP